MYRPIFALFAFLASLIVSAQVQPTCQPEALFHTLLDGDKDDASSGESAPLSAEFFSNPIDTAGWKVRYEWTIANEQTPQTYIIHRYDENLEYTFEQSGVFIVKLQATFINGNDTVRYGEEGQGDDNTFMVNIQQSKLEMPNTFTPNGDGQNDVFMAKEGYQSIVSFDAKIFDRWGLELYSWSDLQGGWDGKYHGSVCKDGVYYLVVKAKGADGVSYNIRRAINLLTKSNKDSTNGTASE